MNHPKIRIRRMKLYRRKLLKYNNYHRWVRLFGWEDIFDEE